MDQATHSIAQLVDAAERLRMVRDAERRFMQLWAQQRTEIVTRALLFPPPIPPKLIPRRGRIPRRRSLRD